MSALEPQEMKEVGADVREQTGAEQGDTATSARPAFASTRARGYTARELPEDDSVQRNPTPTPRCAATAKMEHDGMESLTSPPATKRYLPWLLVLFTGSGCAALIYEIIWLQLLQLVIGSSGISLGVLLGVFMGGMCLGSLLLPQLISRTRHPLKVYAFLELGIGILGIAIVSGIPLLADVYEGFMGHGVVNRAIVAAVCLLPPTVLMGATLPAIARWIKATPEGVSWMGFFYAGNIAGAVAGCLLAGFYLLREYDMLTGTYVAVAMNVAVSLLALVVAWRTPWQAGADKADEIPTELRAGRGGVYIAIGLSGLCALALRWCGQGFCRCCLGPRSTPFRSSWRSFC